jgi:hypothetical protein
MKNLLREVFFVFGLTTIFIAIYPTKDYFKKVTTQFSSGFILKGKRYLYLLLKQVADMKRILLFKGIGFLIIFSSFINAQIPETRTFPATGSITNSVVRANNGDLIMATITKNDLFIYKSSDNGSTWSNGNSIFNTGSSSAGGSPSVKLLRLLSGRILLFTKVNYAFYCYSDDNGVTWSPNKTFLTGIQGLQLNNIQLFQQSDGLIKAFYNGFLTTGLYVATSNDNGVSFSGSTAILTNERRAVIYEFSSINKIIIYEFEADGVTQLFMRKSIDGHMYSPGSAITSGGLNNSNPNLYYNENKLYLFYEKEINTNFSGITSKEVAFMTTTDIGNTWSEPNSYSRFKGDDFIASLGEYNSERFIVTFYSRRDSINHLVYGLDNSYDRNVPAGLFHSLHYPSPTAGSPFYLNALVSDHVQVNQVYIIYKHNSMQYDSLLMYDDGLHGDSLANDGIYGIKFNLGEGDNLVYYFSSINNLNMYSRTKGREISINLNGAKYYLFDINKIIMPFSNNGVLANVAIGNVDNATYDGIPIIFSGGFFLGGKKNNEVWVNAIASASRIEDYVPGVVGSSVNDPKNLIYAVSKDDPAFGESWQMWRFAVTQGADFYDGNNNGYYDPVDINGNGVWDSNEDSPAIIGDLTTFTVYNDGRPNYERRFSNVYPMGIEIQQTLFGLKYDHSIYVRYRIINKGSENLKDVIFGMWSDPDIGDHGNDHIGTDTLINSVIVYDKGNDTQFGVNSPALFLTLLQGATVFIPGETFIDVNGNGIYNSGIDTPLDTAYNFKGMAGADIIPGAKNRKASSSIHYISSHVVQGDPSIKYEAYNYLQGLNKQGVPLDPCSWSFGYVTGGVNCAEVNPLFIFSGDKPTERGWLSGIGWDQRVMINSGPFNLEPNTTVDIITAYTANRGATSVGSITSTKERVQLAEIYYRSNFTTLPPVGVESEDKNIVSKFELFQNYPNPFNPVTRITYSLPEQARVTLKIYDILGREVRVLMDHKEMSAGVYNTDFNAAGLASGIYVYRLMSGDFSMSKKMMVLK